MPKPSSNGNGKDDYCRGGAWGLKLFQSDHDYGMIQDLTDETGLYDLEGNAWAQSGRPTPEFRNDATGLEINSKKEISYHMYAKLCSDIPTVRKYLDRGPLRRVLEKYHATYVAERKEDAVAGRPIPEYYQSGYTYVLIGACAMSLGCKLGAATATLRREYPFVGLMRDALPQMEAATHPRTGYKDGTPWDFGSIGLSELQQFGIRPPKEDRLAAGSINVRAPGPRDLVDKNWSEVQLPRIMATSASVRSASKEELACWGASYPPSLCGGCGKREGLKNCAKCKLQKYCSRKCQKLHWGIHKFSCSMIIKKRESFADESMQRLDKILAKAKLKENYWKIDADDEHFLLTHFAKREVLDEWDAVKRQWLALTLRDMMLMRMDEKAFKDSLPHGPHPEIQLPASVDKSKEPLENANQVPDTVQDDDQDEGVSLAPAMQSLDMVDVD